MVARLSEVESSTTVGSMICAIKHREQSPPFGNNEPHRGQRAEMGEMSLINEY
jgi:hypothetical protein